MMFFDDLSLMYNDPYNIQTMLNKLSVSVRTKKVYH